MKLIILMGLFFSFTVQAETVHFSYSVDAIQFSRQKGNFEDFHVQGFENSKRVGEPSLPVKSLLLVGQPQDIHPEIIVQKIHKFAGFRPHPVQAQPCRCEADRTMKFEYKPESYASQKPYELTYIGAFRGVPVTRLDIPLARYESGENSTHFFTDLKVNHNSATYTSSTRESYNDYLIITPDHLEAGVAEFTQWKRSQGYNVTVQTVLGPQNTLGGIGAIISDAYANKGIDFSIIIGDEETVPMHEVSTSGGKTTTDITYYTLDGSGDTIPDIFYSRIAATTVEDVRATLAKSIEFDQKAYKNKSGLKKIIGIASDEGWSPSDEEYVKSIEDKLVNVLGYSSDHFFQGDKKSNAENLNKSFSNGAMWMVYLGHGSGDSWPSFNRTYEVQDIENISNKDSVKPIIIDVACQNGRLLPDYIGTQFSKVLSKNAFGAAAYYGGTVNISWHPPAIMARGIAFEHADKNFRHLGEALLAGQMYLAANSNNQQEVQDNFEWYQLQGDPGMLIGH